jgi:hypothetical protein
MCSLPHNLLPEDPPNVIFISDLLQNLQEEGFHIYGYPDDIAIIVSGHFLTTIRKLMYSALKITQRQDKTKGLIVNPLKTNIMVLGGTTNLKQDSY